MDNIAIIIPCYNEENTIKQVINNFNKVISEQTNIYVYDNNSTDKSVEYILDTKKAIYKQEKKQGKGNVVRTAFRDIDANIYVIVDADNTYDANDLFKLIEPIKNNNCDMVIGDRLSGEYLKINKRIFHNFGNNLMKNLINFWFKSNIKDVMTGYRAFSRRFVKTFPCLSKGFEVETEMTIHAIDKNLNIENIVINYKDRVDGSKSKLNTYTDGFRVIFTFIKYFALYKSFLFFSMIALIIFILATIFIFPVIIDFTKTHLVPRFPTLIACGFMYIASLQCFFTGLTLELINKKNRQDFEYKLINYDK